MHTRCNLINLDMGNWHTMFILILFYHSTLQRLGEYIDIFSHALADDVLEITFTISYCIERSKAGCYCW